MDFFFLLMYNMMPGSQRHTTDISVSICVLSRAPPENEQAVLSMIYSGGKNMFRIWGKIIKDNHLLRDMTVEDDSDDTRTHKIFHALDTICYEFDLSRPIWLERNIKEFKRSGKTQFRQDNFIEQLDFDFLELHIIEE